MSRCPPVNCSVLTGDELHEIPWMGPEIPPDPDVTGSGVLVGFVGPAYLTFMLVIWYYVTNCFLDHPNYSANQDEPKSLNKIDHGFLNLVQRKKQPRPSKGHKAALEGGVLMFSDLQVVTNFSILSAAYSQLHCGMSSYHWQIVVYTAWFSSVTHLATLTVLRHYFRKQNWKMRVVRVGLMLLTTSMLTAALIPTGSSYWLQPEFGFAFYGGVPAQCYYKELRTSHFSTSAAQTSSLTVSICALWISYITRIIKLSPALSKQTRKYLKDKPLKILKDAINSTNSGRWRIVYDFLSIQFILLQASIDLYNSMLWEILWLLWVLLWGSFQLFTRQRDKGRYNDEANLKNNSWGFSQALSSLLLWIPLLYIWQCLQSKNLRTSATSILKVTLMICYAIPVIYLVKEFSFCNGGVLSDILVDVKENGADHSSNILSVDIVPQDASANQEHRPLHNSDPYIYLWFHALIALLLLLTLEGGAVLFWLSYSGEGVFSPDFWKWVVWVFICLEVYAVAFALWEIHRDWLIHGLMISRLPRPFQRRCGLTTPFIAVLCALAITAMMLYSQGTKV